MDTCETEGCGGEVRRHQTRCDDCIAEEARRRKRQRETTEAGVRGGQGRSGRDVEDSSLIGGLAMLGCILMLGVAVVVNCCRGPGEKPRRPAAAREGGEVASSGPGSSEGRRP